MIEIQCI